MNIELTQFIEYRIKNNQISPLTILINEYYRSKLSDYEFGVFYNNFFNLSDGHVELINALSEHGNTAINVSRNVGTTSLFVLYSFYKSLYNDNYKICISSDSSVSSNYIMQKILLNSPKIRFSWTRNGVEFENGSRITMIGGYGSSKSIYNFYGSKYDLVLFDHYTPQGYHHEYMISQILTSSKKIVLVSQPNYKSYRLWKSIMQNNDHSTKYFNKITIDHTKFKHVTHSKIIPQIGRDHFHREYECKFDDE